jgi:hypothetical protein
LFFSKLAAMASFTDWSLMPSLTLTLGGQRRCNTQYSTVAKTGCICTIARRARAPASQMPQLYRLNCQKGEKRRRREGKEGGARKWKIGGGRRLGNEQELT